MRIAEDNYLLAMITVASVGLVQGAVMGRGIRNRFPKLREHARLVSVILLILFTIISVSSVLKFTEPEKFPVNDLDAPTSHDELLALAVDILGLNAGFGAVAVTSIGVIIFILFRFAALPRPARYFLFAMNAVLLATAVAVRFTDYVPSGFEIIIYAVYQFSLTLGIFLMTRKKEKVVW